MLPHANRKPIVIVLLILFIPLLVLTTMPICAQSFYVPDTIYSSKSAKPINNSGADMRDGPGVKHHLIATLPVGTNGITSLRRGRPDDGISYFDWCLISWQGQTGWVSKCCITHGDLFPNEREVLQEEMYRPLKEQGVEIMRREDLRKEGIAWGHVKSLPVGCPYQGEAETLSFSHAIVESYKRRGFTLKAMCVTLASGQVRFDPERGIVSNNMRFLDS
jgi:hypothetical protein